MKELLRVFLVPVLASGLILWVSLTNVAAAPVVLIDQSHDQRFVIEKDGPLHLSAFAAILKEEGFSVRSSGEAFTDEQLNGVDAVVISGPFKTI